MKCTQDISGAGEDCLPVWHLLDHLHVRREATLGLCNVIIEPIRTSATLRSVEVMNTNSWKKTFNVPLIIGLAALALVRPLFSIVGLSDTLGKPATPIILTVVISVLWIFIVGLSRVREPLLTLVFAGLAYAVFSILLSAVLSPILHGELQGPLTNPFAMVYVLATNALWGLVTGALALGVQRIRGVRPMPTSTDH